MPEIRAAWGLVPPRRRRLMVACTAFGVVGLVGTAVLRSADLPRVAYAAFLAAIAALALVPFLLATSRLWVPVSAEVQGNTSRLSADPNYSRWAWSLTLDLLDGPRTLHGESECLDQSHASPESVRQGLLTELNSQFGESVEYRTFTAHRIDDLGSRPQ
ncbi:hypothetical protein ACPXCP_39155 [Streptomyces sp. DT20]|uniref:hypothetical protein n=1 Tax=Streptomyces sp. DT20 TaxID=3416519 RepID=UPI003CF90B46